MEKIEKAGSRITNEVPGVSRTEKTICLAVSPSLKSYGISGRARLFEVVQKVDRVNRERKARLVKSGINDFSRYRMSQGKHGAIKRLNEWIDRSTGYWHEVDDVLRSTTAKQLKCV